MTSSKNDKQKSNRINLHDLYFKRQFSQLDMAKKLLPLAFTDQELKFFDWNSLKAEKDSFPNNKRADLIFSLGFKSLPEKRIKIYVLLEHKSRKDKQVFHQFLLYNNQITEREFSKTESMPGILNVVFYHGKREWTGKVAFEERSFKQKIRDQKILSFLDKFMLEYRVRILDVGQSPKVEAVLKGKKDRIQLPLYVLRRICRLNCEEVLDTRDRGFLNELLFYLEGLSRKEGSALLTEVISYIEKYFNIEKERAQSAIKKTKNYREEDNMENLLDMYNKDLIKKEIKKAKEGNPDNLLDMYRKDIIKEEVEKMKKGDPENLLDMYNKDLIKKEIKKAKEGNPDNLLDMYRKNVIKEGIQEEKHKTALRMLNKNLDISQISEFTGLSLKKIRELKKKNKK